MNKGIELTAMVASVKTDGRSGAYKVVLDIFPDQVVSVMAAMSMYLKKVKVNMVEIEEP